MLPEICESYGPEVLSSVGFLILLRMITRKGSSDGACFGDESELDILTSYKNFISRKLEHGNQLVNTEYSKIRIQDFHAVCSGFIQSRTKSPAIKGLLNTAMPAIPDTPPTKIALGASFRFFLKA